MTRPSRCPLLPGQARFFTRGLADPHHWNATVLLRVPPALGPDRLARAALEVVNRHAALRSRPQPEDGTGWAAVSPPLDRLTVETVDVSDVPAADRAAELTRCCARFQTSLSLRTGPLFRFVHLTLDEDERRVLVILHHFLVDRLSYRLVLGELAAACERGIGMDRPRACPPAVQATDYARWLRRLADSAELRAAVPAWIAACRPAEPVPAARPDANTLASQETVTMELDRARTALLFDRFLPAHGLDVRQALLAVLAGALHGSGRDHSVQALLLGDGRTGPPGRPDVAGTVGWLESVHPVSLHLDTMAPLGSQLAAARDVFSRLPGEDGFGVLRYLSCDADVRGRLASLGTPPIMIADCGAQPGASLPGPVRPSGESPGPHTGRTGERAMTHYLESGVVGGRLSVAWSYSTQQFDRDTVEGYLHEVLGRLRHGLDQWRGGC